MADVMVAPKDGVEAEAGIVFRYDIETETTEVLYDIGLEKRRVVTALIAPNRKIVGAGGHPDLAKPWTWSLGQQRKATLFYWNEADGIGKFKSTIVDCLATPKFGGVDSAKLAAYCETKFDEVTIPEKDGQVWNSFMAGMGAQPAPIPQILNLSFAAVIPKDVTDSIGTPSRYYLALAPFLGNDTTGIYQPKLDSVANRIVNLKYSNDLGRTVAAQVYSALFVDEAPDGLIDMKELWVKPDKGVPTHAENPLLSLPARFAERLDAVSALTTAVTTAVERTKDGDFTPEVAKWLRAAFASALYELIHPGVRSGKGAIDKWDRRSPFVGLTRIVDDEKPGYKFSVSRSIAESEVRIFDALRAALQGPEYPIDYPRVKERLPPFILRFVEKSAAISPAAGHDFVRILTRLAHETASSVAPSRDRSDPAKAEAALVAAVEATLTPIAGALEQFREAVSGLNRSVGGILREDLLGGLIQSRSPNHQKSIWAHLTDRADQDRSGDPSDWDALHKAVESTLSVYWRDVFFAGEKAPNGFPGGVFAPLAESLAQQGKEAANAVFPGPAQDAPPITVNETLGSYPPIATAKDEGMQFVVDGALPVNKSVEELDDDDLHVRLRGLAFYAKVKSGEIGADKPWRCVSKSTVKITGNEDAVIQASAVDPVAVTARGGLRNAIIGIQGKRLNVRPPRSFDGIGSGEIRRGRLERSPLETDVDLPLLGYGSSYAIAVACITNAGAAPHQVSSPDGIVADPAKELLLDDVPQLKRWFLRTTMVQAPALHPGPSTLPGGKTAAWLGNASLRTATPDVSYIPNPLATEIRIARKKPADAKNGAGTPLAVLTGKQAKKFVLFVTPPTVDFETWRHYAQGDYANQTPGITQIAPTTAQIETVEKAYGIRRDVFLPDPAVGSLKLELVQLFPHEKRPNIGPKIVDLTDICKWSDVADNSNRVTTAAIPVRFDVGPLSLDGDEKNGFVATVPEGCVATLRVRALVKRELFAAGDGNEGLNATKTVRFIPSSCFIAAGNLEETSGDVDSLAGPATEFDIEVATTALPDAKNLFDALSFHETGTLGAVGATGERIDGIKGIVRADISADNTRYAYIDRIQVERQMWDWRGRDVEIGSAVPRKFDAGDAYWAGGGGSDVADAVWFGDRSTDDFVSEEFRVRVLATPQNPLVHGYRVEVDLARHPFPIRAEDRYKYYRFRLVAHSRYASLDLDPINRGVVRAYNDGSPYGWKRLFLAARPDIARTPLPKPAVHAILPVLGGSDFGGTGTLASTLAVWLDGDWYGPAGIARKLECQVERLKRPSNKLPLELEHGSDPVRSTAARNTHDLETKRVSVDGGPMGLTFDLDAEAPRIANSAFRLKFVSQLVQAGDFLKLRFRSVYSGDATGLDDPAREAFASEWTAPVWVQVPAHRDRFFTGTAEIANIDGKVYLSIDRAEKKPTLWRKNDRNDIRLEFRLGIESPGNVDVTPPSTGKYLAPGMAIILVERRGSDDRPTLGRIAKFSSSFGEEGFKPFDVLMEGDYVAFVVRYSHIVPHTQAASDFSFDKIFVASNQAVDAEMILESVSSAIPVVWR